jgi:hypothetical protein
VRVPKPCHERGQGTGGVGVRTDRTSIIVMRDSFRFVHLCSETEVAYLDDAADNKDRTGNLLERLQLLAGQLQVSFVSIAPDSCCPEETNIELWTASSKHA